MKKQFPLEKLFARELSKIVWYTFFALGSLLIFQMVIFSIQSQTAICEILNAKYDQYGNALGREIEIGDSKIAIAIFNEFKRAVEELNVTDNLQLQTNDTNVSISSVGRCEKGIFRTKIHWPVLFGGSKVATISGTLLYLSSVEFFAVFTGLIIVTAFAIRKWSRSTGRMLKTQIIEPIIHLSNGQELDQNKMYADDVMRISENMRALKNNLIIEQAQNLTLEKDRAISKLATKVSHDIRSPLTALNVVINEMSAVPIETQTLAQNAFERIQHITRELLDYNKYLLSENNDPTKLAIYTTLLNSKTEKELEFKKYTNLHITLSSTVDEKELVNAHKLQLQTILSNIINNAAEASNFSGEIHINLAKVENTISIEVRDNGVGISEEVLGKIGNYGFTHGKSDSPSSGTGVAINNAINTLAEWGGKLHITSHPGEGTLVTICLLCV